MPNNEHFRALYRLATAAKRDNVEMKDWTFGALPAATFGAPDFYSLACQCAGVGSLPDADILPVFFTEDAMPLLLSLPNPYWFWRVVLAAIPCVGDGDTHISRKHIVYVVTNLQNQLSMPLALAGRQPIEALSMAEACACVAAGIFVMRRSVGFGFEIVRNPVFQELNGN